MQTYAKIVDGTVYQHIESANQPDASHGNWIACPAWVGPGCTYDGTTFTVPVIVVPSIRVLQQVEFFKRFTQAERIAIRAAAKTNGQVDDFVRMADASPTIDLDDPLVIADMNALEAASFIAAGRSAIILA